MGISSHFPPPDTDFLNSSLFLSLKLTNNILKQTFTTHIFAQLFQTLFFSNYNSTLCKVNQKNGRIKYLLDPYNSKIDSAWLHSLAKDAIHRMAFPLISWPSTILKELQLA